MGSEGTFFMTKSQFYDAAGSWGGQLVTVGDFGLQPGIFSPFE